MAVADDTWASLLPDLLIDIFRRLETTGLIGCAAACKPWRRAIISNASCLRHPRADNFGPSLLLGFFVDTKIGNSWATLHRTPAPCQPMLPEPNARGCCTFVPPPMSGITAGDLLSSRGGFLLVKRRCDIDPISIWNPVTGTCKFLPMPSFWYETYILLTQDDLLASSSSNAQEVRILAVQQKCKAIDDGGVHWSFRYQLFSATSGSSGGAWGPVESSQLLTQGIRVRMIPGTEVVCRGGTVHWLSASVECTVALDLGTGRTWTTDLPTSWRTAASSHWLVLATSRDGRLSVIRLLDQEQIQFWELTAGNEWFLRREVYVADILPESWHRSNVSVKVFCPRSRCVLVRIDTQHVLVDVDTGTSRRIQLSPFTRYSSRDLRYNPYEMDWSCWTMCLSKMKHY